MSWWQLAAFALVYGALCVYAGCLVGRRGYYKPMRYAEWRDPEYRRGIGRTLDTIHRRTDAS